jgi:hypothetical protein
MVFAIEENINEDKSTWLKRNNLHLEIDETQREKYVREAETWLKPILSNEKFIMNERPTIFKCII